jgi:hypothetical protein
LGRKVVARMVVVSDGTWFMLIGSDLLGVLGYIMTIDVEHIQVMLLVKMSSSMPGVYWWLADQ